MVAVTEERLQRMVEVIVREADPERIWLFGSHARGDAAEHSDVDLLIVEREPFGPERSRHAETVRLGRALANMGFAKDILVYSADEVERRQSGRNNVVARAASWLRLIVLGPLVRLIGKSTNRWRRV